MSVSRGTAVFAMGALTGHALATARQATAEAKLARAREALRWAWAYVPSYEGGARERMESTVRETAL